MFCFSADRDLSQFKLKNRRAIRPPPLPKIVGGQEAERHQFPYQVKLFIDGRTFCAAAHCVDGAQSIEVLAGANNIQQSESTDQSIVSNEFVIHEGWDPDVIENNITLIKLPRPLTIHILGTCQPMEFSAGDCKETDHAGMKATVSGWGRSSDSSCSISPVLSYTTDVLLANSESEQYFSIIKDKNTCLNGSNEKGSCNGDSGSPLTVVEDGTIEQVRIVSFGSGLCCKLGFPSAYTRVACYTDWIASNLA